MLLLTTMSVSVMVLSPTFLVAKYVKVVYSVVVMGAVGRVYDEVDRGGRCDDNNYLTGLDLEAISEEFWWKCDRPLIVPLDIAWLRVWRRYRDQSTVGRTVGRIQGRILLLSDSDITPGSFPTLVIRS